MKKNNVSDKIQAGIKVLLLTIISLSSLSFTACSNEDEAPEKPNLLFIWTDQQQAKSMAVYGNDIIQTPH